MGVLTAASPSHLIAKRPPIIPTTMDEGICSFDGWIDASWTSVQISHSCIRTAPPSPLDYFNVPARPHAIVPCINAYTARIPTYPPTYCILSSTFLCPSSYCHHDDVRSANRMQCKWICRRRLDAMHSLPPSLRRP